MSKKKTDISFDKIAKSIDDRDIDKYVSDCFLPFSWSVCLDRALVYAQDGLKPIQRRILWTAYKSGITDTSAKMKSATFEGKVMEYSPHGGCLSGDTMLYSLRYGSIRVDKLCRMFRDGETSEEYTISIDDSGRPVIGKITDVWVSRYTNSMYELTLSDGSVIGLTGNHPLMMSDGRFVATENIHVGDMMRHISLYKSDDTLHAGTTDNNNDTVLLNVDDNSYTDGDEHCYRYRDTILTVKSVRCISCDNAPVYDFSEITSHNAVIVFGSDVDTGVSAICAHNSYGSIVNIAAPEKSGQPRSIRVPLIKGKGNWGGISSPAAASRYTEMNLFPAAMELLKELPEDTVDMVPNYNNTSMEPIYLPARFPVAVIEGVPDAMAVGFACNMPSHNPDEIMDATIALMKNPNMSIADIRKIVNGPDFDCGCDIIASTIRNDKYVDGIKSYMETGSGTFVMKAVYEIEEDNGEYTINFIKLPYKISPEKVVEEIMDAYEKGFFKELSSWKDLSDLNRPVNLEIKTKRNININKVINDLYKKTSLQSTFSANNTIIVDGIPKRVDIKTILNEFIKFRKECTTRKLNFRLKDKKHKLSMQNAIRSVLIDIDKCLKIIRSSDDEDKAKASLISTFNLDDEQATYILSMPLRKLTKSDSHKIDENIKTLSESISNIEQILSDNNKFIEFISGEMEDTKNNISSERKCNILAKEKKVKTEDKAVYLSIDNSGKIMRTFNQTDGVYNVNDDGRVFIVTDTKACIRSIYELSDERLSPISRLKAQGKGLTVAGSDGYIVILGDGGSMKLVDMSTYNYPNKDTIDKIFNQRIIFAATVHDTNGKVVIGDTEINISDIPIQSMTAKGGKRMIKPAKLTQDVDIHIE